MREPAGDADRALVRGQFKEAEDLFAAMPPSDAAVTGQVRALIGQGRLNAAITLASRAIAEHPQSALLMVGLAEARIASGEPIEALATLNRAIALDPCLARTHYDLGRYLDLSGMAAGAQKELDLAYRLEPTDPVVRRAWKATQEPVPTPDSEIADLRKIEARPTETAQQKAEIESVIRTFEADKKGDCELVSPPATATISLVPLFGEGKAMPPTGVALDVVLNGKKRQLLVDTGATGMTISRETADGLGLTPEADVTSSGVGDDGRSTEFIAHLASMKVGNLEFRNCKVRVQTRRGGLDVQGLFGPDTLQSLLLTFDFPKGELRAEALPTLAAEAARGPQAQTIAESRKDRFVAPSMRGWTPVFREAQVLLVPTSIGDVPRKLFILDSGMQIGMIATDVARNVTTVVPRPQDTLRGMNGVTRNTSATGPIAMDFPGFNGRVNQMTALDDLSAFVPAGDMRASGFIGYDVLRHVVLTIDYRDNLIKVVHPAP